MKTILLTILSFSLFSSISAQRNIDLSVNLLSPLAGAQIQPMATFAWDIEISNLTSEPLLTSDSLVIYLIMNGDTIPQMSGNYIIQSGIALTFQQTHVISKMFAFDNSVAGSHIDFCVFVKPYRITNPVSDLMLANNKSCAEIDVLEQVSNIGEIDQENISVFPNPVENVLFISGENITDVILTDQTGKIIMENPVNLSQIDLIHLLKGVYFAKITTEKEQHIRKIVKN